MMENNCKEVKKTKCHTILYMVNAMTIDSSTPLCDASSYGNVECVRLLLRFGALTNPPLNLSTALHEAAMRGHVDCLQELVTAGGKLEAMDLHFGTPLHAACFRESIQCAKVLLKAGANVNALKIHATPLHVAASTDNPDLTTLLLDFGANVHYTDNRGRRPIDIAVGGSVVAGILRSHAETVLPLTQQCRLLIRRHLGHQITVSIHALGLPTMLQNYICFTRR
ncbi:ankyrin repeat and SOCS box protein 13-like isoform X2 [Asterias rubens]|uniref:ankyrin repeat and SOCS box protein 13-like isoform X2 n=1 Tax=Asterias rubens TaxID=7604 RepID=UPI001455AB25|nr:ankyrin repeat and SOCS box protein 13-like isoform X2 [Asterias rubens]